MPGFTTAFEVSEVIRSEDFGARLVLATDITSDRGWETAFAIYRDNDGVLDMSDVLHPDQAYQDAIQDFDAMIGRRTFTDEERSVLLGGKYLAHLTSDLQEAGEPVLELPHINVGPLITTDTLDIRTDLALINHTHPTDHVGRRRLVQDARRLLMPSPSDLTALADQAAHNPDVIAGIIATHTDLGGTALLLMRMRNPDTLQQLGTVREGEEITRERLAALGLNTATVVFNRHHGTVRKGTETLTNLFQV